MKDRFKISCPYNLFQFRAQGKMSTGNLFATEAEGIQEIASRCKEVIADPYANLNKIRDVLTVIGKDSSDNKLKGIAYLSILKVFKAIIPLYKVRSLKDIVKDKRDSLHVKEYDKKMLAFYTSYIKFVVYDTSDESYLCACEILEHLDHFNCSDKIISKVLKGSVERRSVAKLCCDAIRSKLQSDLSGETIFMILNQMLSFDYSPLVVEYLLEIPFLDRSLKSDKEKEEEYWSENLRVSRKDKHSIFRKKPILSKKLKKMEKERLTVQAETKVEEEIEDCIEEFANSKKVYDAIQRLYFTIFKGDRYECYRYAFLGLIKYRRIIRAGFLEGLYFLLNNNLGKLSSGTQIQGVLCILSIYGEQGYDFKSLVEILYSTLYPMNFELTETDYEELIKAIKFLFIKLRQPIHRTHVLLSRLIIHGCSRFVPILRGLVKELSALYDIEFVDCESISYKEFAQDSIAIDLVPNNPFFEHCLYKQML